MYIGWFSCGITSAVACRLAIESYGRENVRLFYIEISSAHDDNDRFISDCERWIGVPIERRRSSKYVDQFDVIERTRYVNGAAGARCTKELKKDVRKSIEEEFDFDGQVFGFEFSKGEINRAIRFAEQHPSSKPVYPLIESKMTKEMCADLLLRSGIRLPRMYELGFHNNNCIGCVKGGKGYWNHVRKHFPDYYDRMAKVERLVGHSCIKGKYLDELSESEGRHDPPIVPDCGTFCEIEFAHIIDKSVDPILNGELSIGQLKLF